MGYRESILAPRGYRVTYHCRQKYPGSDAPLICIAEKNGATFFPFRQTPLAGNYERIMNVQDSVPHMARIVDRVDDVFVFEQALGHLLWATEGDLEVYAIERQLREFAEGTHANGLIHGDLRPWNIFLDSATKIHVIDWGLSCFVDELHKRQDLLEIHLKNMFGSRKPEEYATADLEDAERIVKLMKGEIEYQDAWTNTMPWHPPWCRH